MENETKDLLIRQVREYLVELKLWDADKYQVYQHFVGQCDQFGVTEEEFFKEVLKPAHASINFEELIDDPDPKNEKNTSVLLFKEEIHSLRKLGQVLFNHPQYWNEYFEDASLLKTHVDTLTTGDHALEYARLFREEPDAEKRRLRIIYHLNALLPYQIGGKNFADLQAVLDEAFKDKQLYNQLYNEFVSGRLLVWLKECNPVQFSKVPNGKSYNAFLRFIYAIDAAYPFYLEDNLYYTPYELVSKAQKDSGFRLTLYKYINNDQLFTWFDSIGHGDWQAQYLSIQSKLSQKGLQAEALAHAAIDKLIRIIDPSLPVPTLTASKNKLEFIGIEAGKLVSTELLLRLNKKGYVHAEIIVSQLIEGIKLNKTELSFFDLSGQTENTFTLTIDPLRLLKDHLYEFEIKAITDDETLTIPVAVKTVFPLRTYMLTLVKYSFGGYLVMSIIRFLLGLLTGNKNWLEPNLMAAELSSNLPDNYPAYIFVLLLLIAGIFVAFPLIKKVEKI